MSAESQNIILNAIGKQIRNIILSEIHAAGVYIIMMDCTTDVSHAGQLSLILRYVNAGQDTLKSHSVDLKDAVGHSYDGAAVMTGRYSGVQARIKDVNPRCPFVWTFESCF